MESMTLLSPTGHLGFTPIEEASFYTGVARRPDALIADSGSCDIGPFPLGADSQHSPLEWQRHDLEIMLVEARRLGVPMIIGSAADTGTNRGVDLFVHLIQEIADRHGLPPFRLAAIYAEISRDELLARLRRTRVTGLGGRADLTPQDVERTDRIVAMMGVEPVMRALDEGAEVVICGRSCDDAIYAALPLRAGFPRALAFYLGKVLECASLCAEPFMAKETVVGTITAEAVEFEPMHPQQRCTPASVASHSLYERVDAFFHAIPGGTLDLRGCIYEAVDDRRTRVRGARWIPEPIYAVKLEGAGKVGERAIGVAAIRDPMAIECLETVLTWARQKVAERHGPPSEQTYQVFFHVYGRDGVMGDWEPRRDAIPHEVGIVIEALAPTLDQAVEVATLAQRNIFFARFPGARGTGGVAALPFDEILPARPGYRWTINHLLPLDDPLELFPIRHVQVGGAAPVGSGR
ncbi:MAG: acyclic terpene utilization AtuA family protein [Armatimonadota bacterium]|nr:acyclic terpene utilization AtuA family protein [Armatimonadota bacterium]MDR7469636.1 acyclic terpene utilization AtuA family protein [Armatimonadota bacterium]MDR7474933.1 acyclic terpene utilization AtuA family protein [Armatimonadota bacterium]MDR7538355.1 acyclic terpene utilization AtuA family protein [Armatimonadota bacterium]